MGMFRGRSSKYWRCLLRRKSSPVRKTPTKQVSQNGILEGKTSQNGQMMEFSIVNWPIHCSDKSMGKGGNMKHILLSTIRSFVFVVLVSAIPFVANAQDKTGGGGGGNTPWGQSDYATDRNFCNAKQTE